MKLPHAFLFLCTAIAAPLRAEDAIPLTPADVTRLGLEFAPVRAAAGGSGARFPATVITSPASASQLTAPFGGVIEAWFRAPGAAVRAGDAVVRLRSPEVLRAQQDWMAARSARETAHFEFEKSEKLHAAGIISAQRMNQARLAREQAVFAEQAAAELLRRAGFTPDRLEAMRTRGEGLGFYDVPAGTDGALTRRLRGTGDVVEANGVVATLRPAGAGWVAMQVPARAATGLAVGQTLATAAGAEKLTLRHIDASIDGDSQTIGLQAEFNAAGSHVPGEILAVELPAPAEGVLVAGSAVVHSGDETMVFVRTPNGVAARTLPLVPIGADYLARAGLAPGEQVAVRGAAILKGIKAGLGRNE
jgi:cobalt-zinc-cadmium efflux system membrane fusion protein